MKVLQKFANARNFLTTKAFLTESSLAMDITNKKAPFSETLKWGHCDSSSNTTQLKENLRQKVLSYLNDTDRETHQQLLNTRICKNIMLAASV